LEVGIAIAPEMLFGIIDLNVVSWVGRTNSHRALRGFGPDISARRHTIATSAKVVSFLFIQVGADLITEIHGKSTDFHP